MNLMSKNYLLEIGTEELPARLVGDGLEQLKNNCIKNLFASSPLGYCTNNL